MPSTPLRTIQIACATLLSGAVLGAAPPALATEPDTGITLAHVPPASASAGKNLTISASVTAVCPILHDCSGVQLSVYYLAADGSTKVLRDRGTYSSPTAETLEVTIPGSDIGPSTVRYFIEASQEVQYFSTHYVRFARSPTPESGLAHHTVPVTRL